MEKLAKKIHGSRFKLRIDEDDILNDALTGRFIPTDISYPDDSYPTLR